jgi:hypothetical protein
LNIKHLKTDAALAWLGLLEDVRPNKGTFPQSSTGTLVVLRYPTQIVGTFYVKMLRYWLTILMDFSLASDLEIFSKSTNVDHITSKTRCTSAKVSFTWVFGHIGHSKLSTHQCTIHGMPVITQLWMNVN